jgi:hypothetical protein
MILKHASDIPAVPMIKPGFSGMQARFLLTADDGCPHYAMRLMEFAPGGHMAGCTIGNGRVALHTAMKMFVFVNKKI